MRRRDSRRRRPCRGRTGTACGARHPAGPCRDRRAGGPGSCLVHAASPRCCSCVLATSGSERDVVVRSPGARRRRLEVPGVRGDVALRREAATVLAALSGAEELDGVGNDIYRLPLVAGLVLPLPPFQAAVDGHGAALLEVLGAVLALGAPNRDVEVVGLVGPLAAARVLAARVDCNPQSAHRGPAVRAAQLGVPGEVPGEHYAIDVDSCHEARFLLSCSEKDGLWAVGREYLGGRRAWPGSDEKFLKSAACLTKPLRRRARASRTTRRPVRRRPRERPLGCPAP